jgi:hypothetical protein
MNEALECIETKLNNLSIVCANLHTRVAIIESRGYSDLEDAAHSDDKRLTILEIHDLSKRNAFERWADLAFKVTGTIAAGLILYHIFGVKI